MNNLFWSLPDPMKWAIGLWLFAFGACAGSFMNVVIWRLPQRRSVVYPGSRCPNCGHAVRSYDNIPILNWLILRGRCRDCGVGISWRYPAVETLVACLFVLIALIEPLREGANLPSFPEASQYNWPGLISLWTLYGIQMLLICTLICSALMWFDGHRPQGKLFAPLAIIGLIAPLIRPELRPEQWIEGVVILEPHLAVAVESMLGVFFAVCAAAILAPTLYPRGEKLLFLPAVWEVAVCAIVFGVSGSARITVMASLLALLGAFLSRFQAAANLIPCAAYLAVGSVLHIAFWKPVASWFDSVAASWHWLVIPVALVLTATFSVLTKILARERPGYISGWNRDWPITR